MKGAQKQRPSGNHTNQHNEQSSFFGVRAQMEVQKNTGEQDQDQDTSQKEETQSPESSHESIQQTTDSNDSFFQAKPQLAPHLTKVEDESTTEENGKEEIEGSEPETTEKTVASDDASPNHLSVEKGSIEATTSVQNQGNSAAAPTASAQGNPNTANASGGANSTPASPQGAQEGGQQSEEKQKEEVNISTENGKVYAEGLAAQKPINFATALNKADTDTQQVQSNEQTTLYDSLPEIEQPTGIPTKSQATKAKEEAEKQEQGLQQEKNELADLSPEGKAEGENIDETNVQPPSSVWEQLKSFFGWGTSGSDDNKKSEIKRGIRNLPTSENVDTDPGVEPQIDLSGQADPTKNQKNVEESDQTVSDDQTKNLAESKIYRGEDDVYPEMDIELLSPDVELSPTEVNAALEEELPPVSGEVGSAFDEHSKAYMDQELSEDMAKQDEAFAKMESDNEKERALTDEKIATETANVKAEQEAEQNKAKDEVKLQRSNWQKENEGVKKEFATKSSKEKKKVDDDIDTKTKDTDSKISEEYSKAKKEGDRKVDEANREAKAKKDKAKRESENKSWWDRAVDAVSSFFDALKDALNTLFDGLRKLVKGLIEAAKKLANKLIDLARDAIVGMIKAFGEVLKGLVNIALAAFPKLRDKFNAAIDKAVNSAVDTVNKLAEGLKKAVNALLDALGAVLDAILAAYQAVFNFLIDVMKFLAVGLIKILRFLWNLVTGAYHAPGEFFGQLAEEAIGGNPGEPLKDVEVPLGQEENWANAMGIGQGQNAQTEGTALEQEIPTELQHVLSKQELSDDDIVLEPNPAVELDPELISSLPQLSDGQTLELGGAGADSVTTEDFQRSAADSAGFSLSEPTEETVEQSTGEVEQTMDAAQTSGPDWRSMTDQEKLDHYNAQMLKESENAGSQEPKPGKANVTPNVDNSPEALITKTGRLTPGQRTSFMGSQMMTGLKVFWAKNKVWIIAALVAALLAAGLVAFFTGGAGLALAVDIIVKAMIVIFGAYAIYRAMGFIWEYVKKAWAGDAQGAGKALARAMAIIVMEFLIDKILLGMGKVFSRMLKAAKATRVGKAIVKGAKVVRKGATKAMKPIKKGIAKIKGSKLVVSMKSRVGKGVKSLGDLRQKILSRFGFKRIWLEKHGKWIEIWGEFNAKMIIVRDDVEETVDVDNSNHYFDPTDGKHYYIDPHSGNIIEGKLIETPSTSIRAADPNYVDGLPFAYKEKNFRRFVSRTDVEFKAAGYDDVEAFMQGSATSGAKYNNGNPIQLDSRAGITPSDYDVAIVSPQLLSKADELGLKMSGEMTPYQIAALGLSDVQEALTKASKGGKIVNFKLYRSVDDVYSYGKTIPFSQWK